jgi:crotonobetainyl-CoA:carnitine CoA-transferase CaiB-like acyl-CoA transferase
VGNRDELVPRLAAIMLTRTKADWLSALEEAKVPCGPINNMAEVFADPQVQARDMVGHWRHPLQEDLRLVASPIKLSETPVRGPRSGGKPPPLLGQHTDGVLLGLLGYGPAKVAELRAAGVI